MAMTRVIFLLTMIVTLYVNDTLAQRVPLNRDKGRERLRGRKKPNIMMIVLDDAGWNDFESHDPLMVTPNIKKLREEGVFLNQSYVLPMCGPTRGALLTGRYPHTYGMQDNTIGGRSAFWLNETFTLLPQAMKKEGYRTHMLGKWHMGFCHSKLLPLGRGFDTFYGFWLGSLSNYTTHSKGGPTENRPDRLPNYAWRDQNAHDPSANGTYQTHLLNRRAVEIVQQSEADQPFFMYLSYGAPHGPFEVPLADEQRYCSHIRDAANSEKARLRRVHCAMMAVLDKGIGDVVHALKDKDMYDDTVILVMSDNGGPITDSGSSNWPLRGEKKTLMEGGTRAYTVLKAKGLRNVGGTWNGLIHAIDWLPTLLRAAGGRTPSYVHGKDLWNKIKQNRRSGRTSFLYNVNDFTQFNHTAYRWKKWKLISAVPRFKGDRWQPGFSWGWYDDWPYADRTEDVKMKLSSDQYLLYNLEEDPNERNNLASIETRELRRMKKRLERLEKKYPLYPYPWAAVNDKSGKNTRGGRFVTCWCELPDNSPCVDPDTDII